MQNTQNSENIIYLVHKYHEVDNIYYLLISKLYIEKLRNMFDKSEMQKTARNKNLLNTKKPPRR